MKRKVTIQDIADELGVSRNTVSKAINNSEGLAPATRDRILQKAMEMDYKQFSYVSTLAGITNKQEDNTIQYNGEIALLTTQYLAQSHFASLMLDRFQRELTLLGYTLNTHRVSAEELASKKLPPTFFKEKVKGIVCIEMFDVDYDRMVCDLDIPVLFIDGPSIMNSDPLSCDQLYMNNFNELIRFINKKIAQGYRNIGFIGDYDHCQSFNERYCAYRLALQRNHISAQQKFIIRYEDKNRDEMKRKLADLDEMPDLFICANDFIALEAMAFLKEKGIKVPDDVMFCGFDDSSESRHSDPQLTTVHIHTQVMAYEAIHLLMSRIKEPSLDFRMIYTETDLIERASTKD